MTKMDKKTAAEFEEWQADQARYAEHRALHNQSEKEKFLRGRDLLGSQIEAINSAIDALDEFESEFSECFQIYSVETAVKLREGLWKLKRAFPSAKPEFFEDGDDD